MNTLSLAPPEAPGLLPRGLRAVGVTRSRSCPGAAGIAGQAADDGRQDAALAVVVDVDWAVESGDHAEPALAAAEAQSDAERRFAATDEQRAGVVATLRATEEQARGDRALADAARVEAEDAELVLSRAKAEGAHVEERREAARRALDAARSRLAAAETRRLVAEGEALAAIVHALQGRRAAAGAAVELASSQTAYDSAAAPIAELEREMLGLEAEHAEVAVAVARANDEREAAEHEVAVCEAAVAEYADAVRDQTDDDTIELDPAAAERAEREIIRLERRISALGAVNALAPEQHEALSARVITVAAQRDDLAQSCAELRAMARQLEREIERRFLSTPSRW